MPPRPTTSASRRLRRPRALVSTASIAISVGGMLGGGGGLLEVLLEDPERRRCCGRPAVAAVLDHGADGDRRLLVRAVAAPPRLRQVLRILVARQRHVLL